jgi:hypothetical protein
MLVCCLLQVYMMQSMYIGINLADLRPRLPQIRINKPDSEGKGGYRAAKLTYRDSNFSAIALLCDEKEHGLDAAACLNSLDMSDVLNGMGWRDVNIGDSINLPRFEVEVKQLSVTKVSGSRV